MRRRDENLQVRLLCGAAAAALLFGTAPAMAQEAPAKFNIAAQPLADGLNEFARQSGRPVMFTPEVAGARMTRGVNDVSDPELALNTVLADTGLTWRRSGDTFLIVKADAAPQSGSAAGDGAGTVEALIVTAQKREEDIQDVPIAISAFSQEDLTRSQVAGGPDLMTQVPNMTFTKTNFSSYSIQIRGIGTQAISATTDPAVAVAFNNTPFVRNRFFEQEFYDLQRVEVLRGPQGTLYGRNATAGVVNIISAKPKFIYEAKASADVANYNSTRIEGMVNIPVVEDVVALRLAGAWTKRDGFVTNEITGNPIDGRDLWSTRLSLRITPNDRIDANLVWEHFEEDDDRLRSGKQLCKKDLKTEIAGVPVPPFGTSAGLVDDPAAIFSQGCSPASLYSPDSFETPNGFSLPYYQPLSNIGLPVVDGLDPYLSTVQSRDLRVIESTLDPEYRSTSDLFLLQADFELPNGLTLTSETAYNADVVFSMQDFNRFNTAPGAFDQAAYDNFIGTENYRPGLLENGVFCDPQLGCSDRLVAVDVSTAESRQFSQELRLSSDFDGPFNFSIGANYLRYDTEDKYYVFINTLSMVAASTGFQVTGGVANQMPPYEGGVSDNHECLGNLGNGWQAGFLPGDPTEVQFITPCTYIDPNPIGALNDLGHNYFLSRNPYKLISYAAFGEVYYQLADNLKITGGLRWTVDKKEAPRIPSWLLGTSTVGYPVLEVVEQEWREPTGRLTIDWKPDLGFTDETLVYASYAHGYKAGGANPPPTAIIIFSDLRGGDEILLDNSLSSPKTFDAEYVNAFEVGTKNTLLDGAMTLNLNAFYYDYKGYQISQIVDRSASNLNFDAEVWGAELEVDWRPLENLRLGFKGGYENTRVADGMKAIDLMDRANGGLPDENGVSWIVARPFPTVPSNCILPLWLVTYGGEINVPPARSQPNDGPCALAYLAGLDPVTELEYEADPEIRAGGFPLEPKWAGYPGFDPTTAPNNGQGFFKDLSGNELPNAPHFTATLTADYTVPLPNEWLMTLHTDLYYQSEAWTRIFNMEGYDKLKAYSNINFAAIFANEESGWNVMAYVKNVLDRDSITGAFLNSDDTGLTTNVFLTEPRLYGLRVTKSWTSGPVLGSFGERRDGPRPFTVELAGGPNWLDSDAESYAPSWIGLWRPSVPFPISPVDEDLDTGDDRQVKLTWRPGGLEGWRIMAGMRYGRANSSHQADAQEQMPDTCTLLPFNPYEFCAEGPIDSAWTEARDREEHTLADFSVGRDVGLGAFGEGGESAVSVGLRYADFKSQSVIDITSNPDFYFEPEEFLKYQRNWHHYDTEARMEREFRGVGPILSWEASSQLLGGGADGALNIDWSVTGGVLFGKQKATAVEDTTGREITGSMFDKIIGGPEDSYVHTIDESLTLRTASQSASVPIAGFSLGLSYDVDRFKIGAGYRWERYFDVIDGGLSAEQTYDRTIDGPYFKIAVGFGG